MATRGQDIISVIKQRIEQFGMPVTVVDVGTVIEVGDGIARIQGLAAARYNELLQFPNQIMGIAMNLEEDSVAAIIIGDYSEIKEGDEVRCTGQIAEVPVGEALIGRVVNSLGMPIDGKGAIKTDKTRPLERVAPNVTLRKPVDTPVQTGIKVIDSMIPLGRGQRELIIGDRSIGKTAITLDTIINQKGGDLTCIYVAIGQKVSKVARVVATLENHGAMGHTIVVAANASERSLWSRGGMPWLSMTTFPNMPGLIGSFHCYSTAPQDGRLTPAMFSTCTVAYWRGQLSMHLNMAVAL